MQLAIFKRSDESSSCLIEQAPGGFTLKQESASITIDASNFLPNQMQFVGANNRSMVLINQTAYVDARDWQAVMRQMDLDKVIAGVYFGATPDESVLVVSEPCNTDIKQAIEVKPGPFGAVAAELVPSAAAVRRRNAAKMELVRVVNPLDSLSSLEKQVDLLSSLVLQLATLVPGANDIELADMLRSMLDSCSSNAGKTEDQVMQSITDFKRSLRQAQADYFAKRDGVL